jgi:hypothetical protein
MCGPVRLPTDYSELKINAVRDYYRDLKDQRRFNVPPTSIVPALISRNGEDGGGDALGFGARLVQG